VTEAEKMDAAIKARGDRYYEGTRKMLAEQDRDHAALARKQWHMAFVFAAIALTLLGISALARVIGLFL